MEAGDWGHLCRTMVWTASSFASKSGAFLYPLLLVDPWQASQGHPPPLSPVLISIWSSTLKWRILRKAHWLKFCTKAKFGGRDWVSIRGPLMTSQGCSSGSWAHGLKDFIGGRWPLLSTAGVPTACQRLMWCSVTIWTMLQRSFVSCSA